MEGNIGNSGFWNIRINGRMNFAQKCSFFNRNILYRKWWSNNPTFRFANRGKRTRRKKREHRHGRFFSPLSFNFTHRGAASMLKCYTTIDSLFFSLPLISSSSLENKKKEKKRNGGSNETRWIKRKNALKACIINARFHRETDSSLMHARINETSTSWLGFTYTPPCQFCDRTVNRGTMRERVNGINQTRDWN